MSSRRKFHKSVSDVYSEQLERRLHLCYLDSDELLPPLVPPGESLGSPKNIVHYSRSEVLKVLVLRVQFNDEPNTLANPIPYSSDTEMNRDDAAIRDFYRQQSGYGQFDLQFTLQSAFVSLPQIREKWNQTSPAGLPALRDYAVERAQATQGLDPTLWNIILVRASVSDSPTSTGYAQLSGTARPVAKTAFAMFIGDADESTGIAAHEIGHTLGLRHASDYRPGYSYSFADNSSAIDDGVVYEYGDVFSMMGYHRRVTDDLSVIDKYRMGWLSPTQVPLRDVTDGVVQDVKLYAHDDLAANTPYAANQLYGVITSMDSRRDYWLEYRARSDYSIGGSLAPHGIQIRWNAWSPMEVTHASGPVGGTGTVLVDTHPLKRANASIDTEGKQKEALADATLTVGESFTDQYAANSGERVTFTTLETGQDDGGKFCRVRIRFGSASDIVPAVTLTASTLELGDNRNATFTASVIDTDPGAVASYAWEIGEPRLGWRQVFPTDPDQPAKLNYTFGEPGVYRVRVTASDQTGNTMGKTIRVLVGTDPYLPQITGRVVDKDGNPISNATVAFTHTIVPASSVAVETSVLYDTAITDADGSYALVRPLDQNGTPVPWTGMELVAFKTGYSITPVKDLQLIAPNLVAISDVARTRIDFLAVARPVLVTGTAGGPFEISESISIHVSGPGTDLTVWPDADGNYAFSVPPGRYTMMALAGGVSIHPFLSNSLSFEIDALGSSPTVLPLTSDGWTGNIHMGEVNQFRVHRQGVLATDGSSGINYAYNQNTNIAGTAEYLTVSTRAYNSYIWLTGAANGTIWVPNFSNPVTLVPGVDPTDLSFTPYRDGTKRIISGQVTGSNGEPLGAVSVQLSSNAGQPIGDAIVTDGSGIFAFTNVDFNDNGFKVSVSKPGYTFDGSNRVVSFGTSYYADVGVFAVAPNFYPTPSPTNTSGIFTSITQVVGATGALSVSASGDPSIRYTWSILSPNADKVHLLANGTTSSSTVQAVFEEAGTYEVSVSVTDRYGRSVSPPTNASVVVGALADRVAPAFRGLALSYAYDEQALYFQFSEPVQPNGGWEEAFFIINNTTDEMVPFGDLLVDPVNGYDPRTNTVRMTMNATESVQRFEDGVYSVVVRASEIHDVSSPGNLMASDDPGAFFALVGDIDHDGAVDFDDLLILTQNYGQAVGATWLDGDFNYDGKVDFEDLLALSQRYGINLFP